MRRRILVATVAGLLLAGRGLAQAAVVYDNDPINGTVGAGKIESGRSVSDSFIVSKPVDLTSALAGLWADIGAVPASGSGAVLSNETHGPSIAYQTFNRSPNSTALGAESFPLYSAVPEPTTMFTGVGALCGLGALALVFMALGARSRRSNVARVGK